MLTAALFTACTEPPAYVHNSDNFELIQLADGIYACIHKVGGKAICNTGIIDNGEETLIFDSFLSPDVAKEMLIVVERLGLSPVKYLINSHYHNDHIRGNQVFPAGVKIISTRETADLIREWEPKNIEEESIYALPRFNYYDSLYRAFKGDTGSLDYQAIRMWKPYFETLARSHTEIQTRLPDFLIKESYSLEGPGRRAQLLVMGKGHTPSDLVLYLPDDKVLFAGDLVFNMNHPWVADGSISGWEMALEELQTLDATAIVPGHGPIGGKQTIAIMENYLSDLSRAAREMKEAGLSAQDASSQPIPEQYKNWLLGEFYPSNLRFALDQLAE